MARKRGILLPRHRCVVVVLDLAKVANWYYLEIASSIKRLY